MDKVKANMKECLDIINRGLKFEEYAAEQIADGGATTIDELYKDFYWGPHKVSYGQLIMNITYENDDRDY